MRTLIGTLFSVIVCLTITNAYAADVHWKTRLSGQDIPSGNQIVVDGDFSDLLLNTFTDADQFGYVRLGIEEAIGLDFRGTRKVDVKLHITTYSDNNVVQSVILQTLSVEYSDDGTYSASTINAADYRLPNIHKFKVEVVEVSIYDESSNLLSETMPNYIFLESGIKAERYYVLDQVTIPNLITKMAAYNSSGDAVALTNSTVDGNTDEIFVSWDYIQGAEYYDLEWTWVDNYSETSLTALKSASLIEMDENEFRHNSTRIRTSDQFYRIPHTFSRGYIVFRVRGVGRWQNAVNSDLYGRWTTSSSALTHVSDWPDYVQVTSEHEAEKNWQYQATYAEEGKKKEVISYFDGSLRSRQKVTRINSDDNSVVGETVYDNQGRGVIQILPVPQKNPAIQYYANVNKNSANIPYSHLDFDWELEQASACSRVIPGALNSNSGAAQYYSAAGHSTDTDWQQYVPEANGYAFTQVEYTPDNTGRIRSQSGVGTQFKLGSGKETQYFYAQASQEELNRLFGYKVGLSQHYKKNMVIDANGQVSISYLDPQGRVVATSLAGDNATAFDDLVSESSGGHGSLTTDILNKPVGVDVDTPEDNNDLISTGAFGVFNDGLEVSTQITVIKTDAVHEFDYEITTGYYEEFCDAVTGLKFPFIFDLELSLMDDCGNEQFSTTYYNLIGDEELNATVSEFLQINSQIPANTLTQGTYTLTKRLTLNKAAFETYLIDYLDPAKNACLLESSDFSTTLSTDCSLTCDECVAELGSLSSFLQQAAQDEGASLTTSQVNEYTSIYNQLKDACMAPCEILTPCDAYHDMMLIDLTPNGQYASTDPADVMSVLNTSNNLNGNWKSSGVQYLDQFGNPALVAAYLEGSAYQLDDNGTPPQMVAPEALHLESFIAAFQPSWAEALLPYHPEYVYYQYAGEICNKKYAIPTTGGTEELSSDEFDAILINQISSYELAGTGAGGNPFGIDFIQSAGDAIYDIDPYFNTPYTVHGSLTTLRDNVMIDVLSNYDNNTGHSLLEAAVVLAVNPNDPQSTLPASASNWADVVSNYSGSEDAIWEKYKFLYISVKARLNQYLMDIYGMENDVYNGCIGPDNYGPGTLPTFAGNAQYNNMVQEYMDATFNLGIPQAGVTALCGSEYDEKEIRIVRTDGLYNTSLPSSAMAEEGQAMADYAQWQNTGLCPLTVDMERLLNQLAVDNLLLQTSDMTDVYTMVPDLYEAVTGGVWELSSELEMSGSIVSSQLELNFVNPTSQTTHCKVTLPALDGANLPWSTYGTSWNIFNIYNSYPTGVANDVKVIVLAGVDLASAQEYVITYTNDCTNLNTCQTDYVNNNQYDADCDKEEKFENAIEAVLIELTTNGTINNSSVSLNGIASFSNSVLVDYFDGNVIWNGTTGTFNFTSGNFNVGFVPAANTFQLNSYDIVGNSAYGSTFSGSPSSPTESTLTGGYQYTSSINTLDFNCDCLELNNEQSAGAVDGSVNSMYLDLFNYIWNNPNTSNATPVPTYIEGGAEGFDYATPAFFDVAASESSLSFSIDDINGTTCRYSIDLTWSGYTIDYFTNVIADIDLPTTNLTIEVMDTKGNLQTISVSITDGDCSLLKWCDDCDVATLLEPISCTKEYVTFENLMMTRFQNGYQDIDQVLDEDSIFIIEYIGSQEDFCNFSYAYIYDAYFDYLTSLNINTVNDPQFLTIGEFGNTALGYLNAQLLLAIDDYKASIYSDVTNTDYLTWNEYVDQVYVNSGVSIPCPPSLPAPYFPNSNADYDCNQWINNVYVANEANQYHIYLEQTANAFMEAYAETALSTVIESFTKTYPDKEYHYTLYYYDRGGNLIQTVPPKGVQRIELSQTPQSSYEYIDDFRENNPTEIGNEIASITYAPEHTYETVYRYNSLNQLVYQKTPDGGESRFAYDALGRLVMSQNAKQLYGNEEFSYTVYDELGRVIEVGEMQLSGYTINDIGRLVINSSNMEADVNHVAFPTNLLPTLQEEVTRTIYDELVDANQDPLTMNVVNDFVMQTTTDINVASEFESYASDNTRNRIVGVVYQQVRDNNISDYESAIFYDYDVHGNVKELIQVYEHDQTKYWNQHVKHINYEYDLISGNVNQVIYQKDQEDQFIHRYSYDSDNRIVLTETSNDGTYFEQDAKYFYYDHGPLARTEIGDGKVQAMDYAYTIQGWIKTVNGEAIDPSMMMGTDGRATTLNENVARDAFGYSLSYYQDDYDAYNTAMLNYSTNVTSQQESSQHGNGLYNGNIRAMYTALSDYSENALETHQTKYSYDQLNRIKAMDGYNTSWSGVTPSFNSSGYSSSYDFDENGNLTSLTRNAWNGSTSILMDDFTYHYEDQPNNANDGINNRLDWVEDHATNSGGQNMSEFSSADIDGSMNQDNYEYDLIGQLMKDVDEDITSIEWKVTNKVERITYGTGKTIAFDYDPMGNRISKIVQNGADINATFYILDAQGNQMATYTASYTDQQNASAVLLQDRMIYGSSRLGNENLDASLAYVNLVNPTSPVVSNYAITNSIGDKYYELSNHLGNVLNVVTDRKLTFDDDLDNQIDYFTSDVISYSDYYPYGMVMPNRNGAQNTSYRYGFQGQEKDDEIKGQPGNSINYNFRMHDPRVGRWLSLDPMASKYPDMSPYISFGNNPVLFVDLQGDTISVGSNQSKSAWASKGWLQLLTNDKLSVDESGNIYIVERNAANTDEDFSVGTELIRELIEHDKTVEISLSYMTLSYTDDVNGITSSDGTGSDARISFNRNADINNPSRPSRLRNSETGEVYVTNVYSRHMDLAHELIHAYNMMEGRSVPHKIWDTYSWKRNDGAIQTMSYKAEEYRTTGLTGNYKYTENKIRREHGIDERVTYTTNKIEGYEEEGFNNQ